MLLRTKERASWPQGADKICTSAEGKKKSEANLNFNLKDNIQEINRVFC